MELDLFRAYHESRRIEPNYVRAVKYSSPDEAEQCSMALGIVVDDEVQRTGQSFDWLNCAMEPVAVEDGVVLVIVGRGLSADVQAVLERTLEDEPLIDVTPELLGRVYHQQDQRMAQRIAQAVEDRINPRRRFGPEDVVWAKTLYGLYEMRRTRDNEAASRKTPKRRRLARPHEVYPPYTENRHTSTTRDQQELNATIADDPQVLAVLHGIREHLQGTFSSARSSIAVAYDEILQWIDERDFPDEVQRSFDFDALKARAGSADTSEIEAILVLSELRSLIEQYLPPETT